MVETDLNQALRESAWEGYIGFTVKAKDNEQNNTIHEAFRTFCKLEADNNYTQGLKMLLDYYSSDMKYEAIWAELQRVKEEMEIMKSVPVKDVKKEQDIVSF
jgi:hypothetical protein